MKLKRDDHSLISLSITPRYNDDGGGMVPNGVYDLSSPDIDDIGELAFHLEDKHQWEYCGNVLTADEVDQVVTIIQELKAV